MLDVKLAVGASIAHAHAAAGVVYHCGARVHDVSDLADVGESWYLVYLRHAAYHHGWVHVYPPDSVHLLLDGGIRVLDISEPV